MWRRSFTWPTSQASWWHGKHNYNVVIVIDCWTANRKGNIRPVSAAWCRTYRLLHFGNRLALMLTSLVVQQQHSPRRSTRSSHLYRGTTCKPHGCGQLQHLPEQRCAKIHTRACYHRRFRWYGILADFDARSVDDRWQ